MNRRQLFGWLAAVPFVPAVLARPAPVELKFVPTHVNTGSVEVSGANYARVDTTLAKAEWGNLGYYYEADLGALMEDREWVPNGGMVDMKYRPRLPEWF